MFPATHLADETLDAPLFDSIAHTRWRGLSCTRTILTRQGAVGNRMTFRAVGLGASAGGLEAVSELLSALPAGTGMACVVVQHLDPRHESLLPEILQKRAAVPVTAAVDGEVVQPEHVYIIPPNATLTVADGRFHLTERPAFEHHLPVDALFKSLAAEYAEDAIGVVLSGGDSDGSLGVQAIKHEGGIVFAQRPDRRGSRACRARDRHGLRRSGAESERNRARARASEPTTFARLRRHDRIGDDAGSSSRRR